MTLYKDTYPPLSNYTIPSTSKHESPCMSPYWRSQPIRQGKQRDEIDFEERIDEEE